MLSTEYILNYLVYLTLAQRSEKFIVNILCKYCDDIVLLYLCILINWAFI